MDEFQLIRTYFAKLSAPRADIVIGIGDDAACVRVPDGHQLLVSVDTLVSGVHFLPEWSAYDIASKACRVNISDMAAMAAMPRWLTLSLTMPTPDETWLQQFAAGLKDSLEAYDVMLIGGDTTRGPLNISMSILGIVANGMAVTRKGAKAGDQLYVTGQLGLAACALAGLTRVDVADDDHRCMLRKLHAPNPRVDLAKYLSAYASAAIDISDGLFQDLQHICAESRLGATIYADAVPVHPLLSRYMPDTAFNMAMTGGDDYELCLTVPQQHEQAFLAAIEAAKIICYPIGVMQSTPGVQVVADNGMAMVGDFHGYRHF